MCELISDPEPRENKDLVLISVFHLVFSLKAGLSSIKRMISKRSEAKDGC